MATCYCRYSGVTFKTEGFTHKMEIETIHPIFDLPLDRLLQRVGDWARDSFTPNEERLFFLALLRNTELVQFRATAEPSSKTIKQNTEALVKFINWYKARGMATIALPEFVIDYPNRHLTNIATWIRVWNDAKDDWLRGTALKEMRKKQALSEAALTKLIHSSFKSSDDYAGKLAKWAIEVGNVPDTYKAQWLRLFKLRDYELYGADWYVTEDLEMCIEHLTIHLDAYNSALHTAEVLNHLRILLAKHKAGFSYWLGIEPDSYITSLEEASLNMKDVSETNEEELLNNSSIGDSLTRFGKPEFRILSREAVIQERTKATMIATYAPASGLAPVASDYPNTVAYLRAKAAYNLSKGK